MKHDKQYIHNDDTTTTTTTTTNDNNDNSNDNNNDEIPNNAYNDKQRATNKQYHDTHNAHILIIRMQSRHIELMQGM